MCCRFTLAAPAEALSRSAAFVSAEVGLPWCAAVVDDDLEPSSPSFFEARDDLGFVQIVGDDPDLGLRVGDGLVEHLEDRARRLEAHPGQRLGGLGMGRDEVESRRRLGRKQGGESPVGTVSIHERLRRHEAAGEGDIELSG